MSLSIETDRQVEWKDLHISQMYALDFLFYRSEQYHYYFHFAYRDTTGEKERFCGYAGTMHTGDMGDDSFDEGFPEGVDVYVTANGFNNAYHRKAKHLIGLQNLVIDIDAHKAYLSPVALHEHIARFEEKLLTRLDPQPNFAHQTGRGLQLWYCFEPCNVKLKPIVLGTINGLISQIRQIMIDLGERVLSIDEVASKRLDGLFRLPYTYNTKYQGWSEGKLLHEENPHINELFQAVHDAGWNCGDFSYTGNYGKVNTDRPRTGPKKSKRKSKLKSCGGYKIVRGDYTPCFFHRKKFLDYLLDARDMRNGGEKRELFLFAMYHVVTNLFETTEAAQKYVLELNQSFPYPLDEDEIERCIFKQIDRCKYRLPNDNFLQILDATEQEREVFYSLSRRRILQMERRRKKEERNNRILYLYANGVSVAAIARDVGCSRPTVYSVIEKCKV